MRYILLLLLTCLVSMNLSGQRVHNKSTYKYSLDKMIGHEVHGPTVICNHSDEVIKEYVEKNLTKVPYTKNNPLNFNVNYEPGSNFPQELIDAFEIGTLPLLSEFFNSNVPINIWVENLANGQGNANTLAAAAPGARFQAIFNSPCFDCIYPVALAEKIVGEEITPSTGTQADADIRIFINSDADFYFDFDNPDSIGAQIDFVTTMFHEVLHGIGFTGFAGFNQQGDAQIEFGIFSSAFDNYMENVTEDNLRESFDNGSFRLAAAFESNGGLFWDGFRIGQIEDRAVLFAPLTFSPGSSLHHVDEATYRSGPNALMTPSVSRGQVLRDAGIATEMLYDMGWAMATVRLLFEDNFTEDLNQDFDFRFEIDSDIPYDTSSVALHISTDTFATESVIPLDETAEASVFSRIFEATGGPQTFQWFIEVSDSRGITRTTPSPAPEFFGQYQFLIDTIGPEILHDPLSGINESNRVESIDLTADVTDPGPVALESVFIEWRLNAGSLSRVPMVTDQNNTDIFAQNEFNGTIDFGRALIEGDVLEYRIVAQDESINDNMSTFPADGSFITIPIAAPREPVSFYMNTFDVESNDFEGSGFSIREEPNFSSPAIHSDHPYSEAGAGNSLNLTYELSIPIIIGPERPVIEFQEVVLVEPGDPGTVFGQDRFWDFVVVEGRRQGTQDWIPFADGYDSTDNPVWLSAYRSDIRGNPPSSFAPGRLSQFRTRKINMIESGDFALGDIVSIRFRLFSDPAVFGWGWAIDNLEIQNLDTAVDDFVDEQNFEVIPNPASDEVMVSLNLEDTAEDMQITIVDVTGRLIQERTLSNQSLRIREQIDIRDLESGVYLVNVIFNNRDIITKKLIKQ